MGWCWLSLFSEFQDLDIGRLQTRFGQEGAFQSCTKRENTLIKSKPGSLFGVLKVARSRSCCCCWYTAMTSSIVSGNVENSIVEYQRRPGQDRQCVCWKAERWPLVSVVETNLAYLSFFSVRACADSVLTSMVDGTTAKSLLLTSRGNS